MKYIGQKTGQEKGTEECVWDNDKEEQNRLTRWIATDPFHYNYFLTN
jgi:hypothetical protein